jgi:hypothetical protein
VSSSSIRLRRAWAKRGRAKLATSASFVEACESASFGRHRVSVSLQSRVANLWSLELLFAKLRKRVFMYALGTANVGSLTYTCYHDRPQITRCSTLWGRSAGHPENQERDPLGSASDLPPAYGISAGERKRLGCTSAANTVLLYDKSLYTI